LYHEHNHLPTSTQEPEMMDQRVNKRPYSYYFIGKKLWYIPLYFSIYFIIYVAALVLKSIARHKINFPTNMVAVGDNARSSNLVDQNSPGWRNYVTKVLESIEKYGKVS
jgi:ribose/xylose/arabinose/galactoside ABC-type transport system permease subunit